MSRSTRIYVLILVAFGCGLWVILSAGNRLLVAPIDLSGTWTLHPVGPGTDPDAEESLVIQQSGRYLSVTGPGKPVSLVLETARLNGPEGSQTIALAGPGERMLWTRVPGESDFIITGSALMPGDWRASRKPNGH